jgi:hypothetical protein
MNFGKFYINKANEIVFRRKNMSVGLPNWGGRLVQKMEVRGTQKLQHDVTKGEWHNKSKILLLCTKSDPKSDETLKRVGRGMKNIKTLCPTVCCTKRK